MRIAIFSLPDTLLNLGDFAIEENSFRAASSFMGKIHLYHQKITPKNQAQCWTFQYFLLRLLRLSLSLHLQLFNLKISTR